MDYVIFNKKIKLPSLLAISKEEQENGLMYFKEAQIMCFPYLKPEIHKFWMKNTPNPLDIIFCRAGKIIDICVGSPYSLELVGPEKPTDLIIEIPYGESEKLKLSKNSQVDIQYSIISLAKKFKQRYNLIK